MVAVKEEEEESPEQPDRTSSAPKGKVAVSLKSWLKKASNKQAKVANAPTGTLRFIIVYESFFCIVDMVNK